MTQALICLCILEETICQNLALGKENRKTGLHKRILTKRQSESNNKNVYIKIMLSKEMKTQFLALCKLNLRLVTFDF